MIRVFANNPGRQSLSLLAVLASALAACAPETVGAPASSQSAARGDAGPARTGSQMAAETASPTASGMTEVVQPPARAPSAPSTTGGAGGSDEGKKDEPKDKPGMGGVGGVGGVGGKASAMGGMGGAAMTSAAKKPECMQLSSCCSSVKDDDDREDCEDLVQRDDADRCAKGSSDFCQATAGMGGTAAMSTAGTGGAAAEACMQLSKCCGTLDGLQERACMQAVEEARANACTSLLERRCPELGPVPQEPACATLHDCCGKQTAPRALEQCRRALEDGNRRECERASMQLCQ